MSPVGWVNGRIVYPTTALQVIRFLNRNNRTTGGRRWPEEMPSDHALGSAEGGHHPGGEQAYIENHAGPGKERQAGVMGQSGRVAKKSYPLSSISTNLYLFLQPSM